MIFELRKRYFLVKFNYECWLLSNMSLLSSVKQGLLRLRRANSEPVESTITIDDAVIKQVATHLTYAANHIPKGFMVMGIAASGAPKVIDVVDAFAGLSIDHPFRKEFDLPTVRRGYDALPRWGVHSPSEVNTRELPHYLYAMYPLMD